MTGLLILLATALTGLVLLLTAILVRGMRRPPAHSSAWALARGLPCDPAGLGFDFEEWTHDRPDGARLPVWEVDTTTRAGDGPPPAPLTAVFLHGWGQGRVDLLDRLAPWDSACRRLVLVEGRGHGDATGGPSRLGDATEEADLAALLDRLGPEPVVLVGFSMGAVVAVRTAAARTAATPPIVGLAAYGIYTDFHAALRGRLRSDGLPGRPLTDFALAWLAVRGVRPTAVLDRAGDLAVPMLLLHQTRDPVSPLEHARAVADRLPDATLVVIEGDGHLNVRDTDPEAHDTAVASFLARLG